MSKKQTPWLIAILAAIVLPRLITFFVPLLAIDEAIYAVFGREMLHGAIPYRDLVDYKPPLIFYLYTLAFKLGGERNMVLVHFFHLLVIAATCSVLYHLGKHLRNEKSGLFAALFYAIFSATWSKQHALATNAEPLMVLPLAFATLCLLRSDTNFSWKTDLLGGLSLGIAFLTKYTAGINLLLTLGYLGLRPFLLSQQNSRKRGQALRHDWGRSALYILGFLLPIGVLVLYYYFQGTLQDFNFWGWQYNRSYISQGAELNTWDYFIIKFLLRTGFFAFGSMLVWFLAGKKIIQIVDELLHKKKFRFSSEEGQVLFIVFWLIFSFVPVSMGGRFFFHYYVQLLPPVCLLAALAAPDLWTRKKGKHLIIGLCLLSSSVFLIENTRNSLKRNDREENVAHYLREHSSPLDRLFIWGYWPQVYFHANRRPASRFAFVQFLTGSSPKTHGMDFDPKNPIGRPDAFKRALMDFDPQDPPLRRYDTSDHIVPEAWNMLFEDLKRNRPLYFVDTSPANINRYGNYPVEQYPPLFSYLMEHYNLEQSIDQVLLYRLKEQPEH